MATRSDSAVLNAMVAQLEATGRFSLVLWGDTDRTIPPTGATAVIFKRQVDYDERLADSDDETRVVRYKITLRYNNQDEQARRERIENLENLITNMFMNKSINGLTAPGYTRITRVQDDDKAVTGQSVKYIEGTFGYTHSRKDGLQAV